MLPIDSSTPEARLVAAAKEGDSRAYREIVSRFHTMVYALALAKVRDHDTAEDIVQEVFLRVYLHIDRLSKPEYLGTWMGRITRNLAADWAARNQRSSHLLPTISIDEVHTELKEKDVKPVTEKLDDATREQALNDAIRDLPTEQREIILLHFMQGWNYREIAARLEKDPTTISRILDRTLATLRTKVGDALDAPGATRLRSRASTARTVALLAALSLLPLDAKASLAAATQAAVAASSFGSTVHVGPIASLAQWFKFLSIGKKAAVVVASLTAVGGTTVVATEQLAPAQVTASAAPTVRAAASPVPDTWDINAPGLEGPWATEQTFPRIGLQRAILLITRDSDGRYVCRFYNRDEARGVFGPVPVTQNGMNVSIKNPVMTVDARRTSPSTMTGTMQEGKRVTPTVWTRIGKTPAPPKPKPRKEIAADPKSFEKFAGYYAANSDQVCRFRVDNGALFFLRPKVEPDRIYPESPNKFFSKEIEIQFEFTLDANEVPVAVALVDEIRNGRRPFRHISDDAARSLNIPWITNGEDQKPLGARP
ncbi:hypothetical protein BH09SUM1_BH09SUM1_31270 [soil metagenome]